MRVYTAPPVPARRRSGRPLNASSLGGRQLRSFATLATLLLTSLTAYAAWAVVRMPPFIRMAGEPEYDPAFPRPLPYPDRLLTALESVFSSHSHTPIEWVALLATSCVLATAALSVASAFWTYVLWRR